jgi:hypothetical protein
MKKVCKTAGYEYEWLRTAPPGTAVRVLDAGDGWYTYDWYDGQPALHASHVWLFMKKHVWDYGAGPDFWIDKNRYVDHVYEVSRGLDVRDSLVTLVLNQIWTLSVTPVRYCHGDLTLLNVVDGMDGLKLIDPCDCHGLPCRELDESKLMMSLDGWDFVKTGRWPDVRSRIPGVRRVHHALLATHYLRALAHSEKHCERALEFCRDRFYEIAEAIT